MFFASILSNPSTELDSPKAVSPTALEDVARIEFQFIWRSLRRLGLWSDDVVDDAAQRVFEIATQKWRQVLPGKERAFLYRIAVLVAAEKRRAHRIGQREQPNEEAMAAASFPGGEPDTLYQERQYRAHLDEILSAMPEELREVFVLFEIERMGSAEIAELLDLRLGTVASRLRRARESFQAGAARLRKRLEFLGEFP